MSIIITKDVRIAGSIVEASSTPLSYSAELEADLVARGAATYAAAPSVVDPVTPPQEYAAAVVGAGRVGSSLISNVMGSQIYGAVQAAAQNAQNFCYHMTIVIPTDARRFRVALDNVSATLPFRIKRGAIATSDSIGSDPTFGTTTGQVRFTPQNGTGWTGITWDGGATEVEIAPAVSAGRKRRKWTDWISCPTVANTDGSKLRVVMVRFWVEGTTSSPGNGYCTGQYTQTWRSLAANTAIHHGYLWQCIRSTIDGVTTPANFQPNVDLSTLPFVTSIQYESYAPGMTLTLVGADSIGSGAVNGGSGNFGNGWMWRFVNLMRAQYPWLPIDMVNNGYAGTTSEAYGQSALDYIADPESVIGPAIYQPFSQNDGLPADSIVAGQRARLAAVEAALAAMGRTLAVTTPIPNTSLSWTAPQDAIRLAFRSELLARRAAGLPVIDLECLSNGATPSRYVPAWTTDNAHPNEAGGIVGGGEAMGSMGVFIL